VLEPAAKLVAIAEERFVPDFEDDVERLQAIDEPERGIE